jgi:triacylglycerol lipase
MKYAWIILAILLTPGVALANRPGGVIPPRKTVAAQAPAPTRGLVIAVHGIYGNGAQMRPVTEYLGARGYRCLAPDLTPSGGQLGLRDLAVKLRDYIGEHVPPGERFSLVAYSMGGLVSRDYLQNLGGAARCDGFYTISTPHHGTWMGYVGIGQGAREMRWESDFTRALNDRQQVLTMPLTSYRTPLDLIILPAESSKWAPAENVVDWQLAHPFMLYSRRVQADILRRLGEG